MATHYPDQPSIPFPVEIDLDKVLKYISKDELDRRSKAVMEFLSHPKQ